MNQEPSFLSRRSPVPASRGMVAMSQPLATQASLSILMRGGNAADAVAFNVTEPGSTGLGGGSLRVIGETVVL